MYRRKFRERLGELTPRNLDHPVPVGLVDMRGRRALIYGHPWRGLSSHPVPVLHPARWKGRGITARCVRLFVTYIRTQIVGNFCHDVTLTVAMQRSHLNGPGSTDMADTVSLLNRFASIPVQHAIKSIIAVYTCPLSFSTSHELLTFEWLCH